MDNAENLVNGIYNKVSKLIEQQANLQTENDRLKKDQTELNRILENQNKLIEQLKDENRNLKIAKSVKLAEGSSDVKNKIEELVREIDNCIGLLNK